MSSAKVRISGEGLEDEIADRTSFVRNDEDKSSLDREDLGGLQCKYPPQLSPNLGEGAVLRELASVRNAGEVKRTAFTLAETLITLGIIGVVATITLSILISNYQKHVTANQLKAAYKIFSEALQRAKVDYGDELYLTQEMYNDITLFGNTPSITKTYFDPYINGVKKYSGKRVYIKNCSKSHSFVIDGYQSNDQAPMCTPNGICYWVFGQYWATYLPYLYLAVDLNGPKGPNRAGRDVFAFSLSLSSNNPSKAAIFLKNVRFTFSPYCSYTDISGVQPYWNGLGCAYLIYLNGWKIPDDYPW